MKSIIAFAFLVLSCLSTTNSASQATEPKAKPSQQFMQLLLGGNSLEKEQLLKCIKDNWDSSHEIMALETLYFAQDPEVTFFLIQLLQEKTGRNYGYDTNKWYEYLWNKPQRLSQDYHTFKAKLHSLIDPKFWTYFEGRQEQTTIRFDEIRWGGVHQDGIPPLRNPEMVSIQQADYLEDDNIVFGISVNGDARAYPKRILAWHEMFVDTVGDIPVAGVYCTLCGTVILYKTEHSGIQYEMGTSGFLYRSNKLMYDKATQSLWNTLWGTPVVGPLVGKGIELEYLSVVTTTWGEWRSRHPETTVLSLNTGHRRDYGEGIAYQDYFSTDRLMFNVPKLDKRLKNKQSVLALRLPEHPDDPVAISSKFLRKKPVHEFSIGNTGLLVLTDASGAHRVYESRGLGFAKYDGKYTVTDVQGNHWKLHEDSIESQNGEKLNRIRSFNAFWFGWKAAYPNTKLIR